MVMVATVKIAMAEHAELDRLGSFQAARKIESRRAQPPRWV
jgi:hypothetical protein